MKTIRLGLVLLLGACGFLGCSNNKVDIARLQKLFAAATGELKTEMNTAIPALQDHDLSTALRYMERAFQHPELTPDQKWALSDAINKTALQLEKSKPTVASSN